MKKGDWVKYCPEYGDPVIGRVKSWNYKFVFVVYHCDDNWDDFERYTAAGTKRNHLILMDKREGK